MNKDISNRSMAIMPGRVRVTSSAVPPGNLGGFTVARGNRGEVTNRETAWPDDCGTAARNPSDRPAAQAASLGRNDESHKAHDRVARGNAAWRFLIRPIHALLAVHRRSRERTLGAREFAQIDHQLLRDIGLNPYGIWVEGKSTLERTESW